MPRVLPILLILFCLAPASSALLAQGGTDGTGYRYTLRDPLAGIAADGWLMPSDTFHPSRFYTAAGVGGGAYAAFGVGLYAAWYEEYDLEPFHTFNDWPQWLQMDKAGHAFTAYFFNRTAFAGLRWAGLKRPAARYTALGVANLLQGTIEVMDGFSSDWGFSLTDIGANLAGSLLFTGQDILWQEQRILLKISNDFRSPPDVVLEHPSGATSNLGDIDRIRFGTNVAERVLKDYNAVTVWTSINLASTTRIKGLPPWLNLAVGYGVEDVYGAYGNSWREDGYGYLYRNDDRRRQWFLSPDLYLSRIPTNKRWVRLVLGVLDFVKVPSPALEYSRGRFHGHWIM